jgi:hypothetical protein
MFEKLKALIKTEKQKPEKGSRSSREVKTVARADSNKGPIGSSREVATPPQWLANFEGFRSMLKDLSRRLVAIRENPEETYLINTEVIFRVVGVLENLSVLTERNTAALEKLSGQALIKEHKQQQSKKIRRAREVLGVFERCGALSYEELREELRPQVSYNRVTALVSEMIRDGVPLVRDGKPVRVSFENSLTGSN